MGRYGMITETNIGIMLLINNSYYRADTMSIQYIVCFKRNKLFNYPGVAGSPDPAPFSTAGLPHWGMRIELGFVSSK